MDRQGGCNEDRQEAEEQPLCGERPNARGQAHRPEHGKVRQQANKDKFTYQPYNSDEGNPDQARPKTSYWYAGQFEAQSPNQEKGDWNG